MGDSLHALRSVRRVWKIFLLFKGCTVESKDGVAARELAQSRGMMYHSATLEAGETAVAAAPGAPRRERIMVQVDVFWAYGLGAGFALASARQLRVRKALRDRPAAPSADQLQIAGEPGDWNGGGAELSAALNGTASPRRANRGWANFSDLLQNRYMVANILYAALLFAPSGIYLLWGFPNWETMQAGGHSMPAWLIVLFAITNVTQAIVGFWVTERLIVSGRQYLGLLQVWAGYFGMFFILVNGWDKTGWHRFFSEDKADFAAWSTQPALDQVKGWLTSDVALTLYAMGVVLIPVMAVIMVRSLRSGYVIGGAYKPDRRPAPALPVIAATAAMLLSGVPAAIVAHLLITSIGWLLGSIVSALVIYLVLLQPRFGLLIRGYRLLALEDPAYAALRAGRPGTKAGRPRQSVPQVA